MALKTSLIRTLYFYVISAIGLLMISFSTADLINLGLKTWVFPKAEEFYFSCPRPVPEPTDQEGRKADQDQQFCLEEQKRQLEQRIQARAASAVRDFSFLVVGLPLFWFHFRVAQKERREDKENGN